MNSDPRSVWRSFKFLFVGPLILLFLFIVNYITSPHYLWVRWAALGIGIAWFFSLIRVLKAALIVGGLAALFAALRSKTIR